MLMMYRMLFQPLNYGYHQAGRKRKGNGFRVGAGVEMGGVGPLVGARGWGYPTHGFEGDKKKGTAGAHKGPHPASTPPPPLRVGRVLRLMPMGRNSLHLYSGGVSLY